jgi:hypothetical protein
MQATSRPCERPERQNGIQAWIRRKLSASRLHLTPPPDGVRGSAAFALRQQLSGDIVPEGTTVQRWRQAFRARREKSLQEKAYANRLDQSRNMPAAVRARKPSEIRSLLRIVASPCMSESIKFRKGLVARLHRAMWLSATNARPQTHEPGRSRRPSNPSVQ